MLLAVFCGIIIWNIFSPNREKELTACSLRHETLSVIRIDSLRTNVQIWTFIRYQIFAVQLKYLDTEIKLLLICKVSCHFIYLFVYLFIIFDRSNPLHSRSWSSKKLGLELRYLCSRHCRLYGKFWMMVIYCDRIGCLSLIIFCANNNPSFNVVNLFLYRLIRLTNRSHLAMCLFRYRSKNDVKWRQKRDKKKKVSNDL